MERTKHLILRQIAGIKHRLWVKQLLETAASGLLAGAGVAAVLALFSVFWPVAHLYLWEGAILAAGLLTGILAGAFRLPTDLDAAKRIDAFGLKERIVTALEFRDREDALSRMQREDALQALEAKKDEIRVAVFTGYRTLLLAVGMAGIAFALSLIPSPAKKQAQDLEKAQLLVKETQKEIKKVEDALGQIPEAELSEEQKKQLQEMRELLAQSKASLGKVKTPEQADKEGAKTEYNFAEMSKQLVMMAQEGSGKGADELEKAAQQIDDQAAGQMAQNQTGENGQKPGESPASDPEGEPRPGQSGEGGKQDSSAGQDGQNKSDGEDQSGSGQESQNGSGGDEDRGNENGENTDAQEGNGPGEQNNNGAGNGMGEGFGEGQENGSGRGSGEGDKSGPEGGDQNGGADGQGGSGQSDFGSGSGQHDYVSIPKKTGDDENLTGKNQGIGQGDISRQQNGLSWEGEHVDGQAVMGEYAKKAYDGISRGEYPEGMEDVIKQYFNGF